MLHLGRQTTEQKDESFKCETVCMYGSAVQCAVCTYDLRGTLLFAADEPILRNYQTDFDEAFTIRWAVV